jgi:hypothetical protein
MKDRGWRGKRAKGLLGRWSRLVGGVRELKGDWMMEKRGSSRQLEGCLDDGKGRLERF